MAARPSVVRFIKGTVLAGWMCALWVLLDKDRYVAFLRVQMWPVLEMGLLILIGYLWAMLRQADEHGEPDSPGTTLIRGAWLLLPLLYATLCAGQTLGSYAFEKRSLDLRPSLSPLPGAAASDQPGPADQNGASRVTLIGIHRNFASLEGRRVVAEGFVHHEKALPDGTFIAFRFLIYCCAADAQPVGVLIRYGKQQDLPEEAWVSIEGDLAGTVIGGKRCPTIDAQAVTITKAPDNPYLY